MAGEREFRTDITANTTPLTAAMQSAVDRVISDSQRMQSSFRETFSKIGDSVKETFNQMNSSFDGFVGGVNKIRGVLLAVGAVIAGGAMFGKAITQTAEMTEETRKLSTMLGITLEAASALRIAISDIELTTDDYTGMVAKMTMKLREGEDRFNELGIKTRGANGELLDTEQITTNALDALKNFKEGTDRNLASTELFGKGWDHVNKLLRLTPEVMEEARQKAVSLELQIGPEGAARTRQYEMAMNDVKDVFEALSNRVGQALMPILTEMGNWFASIGPAAVVVMRGAIGAFAAVFWSLKLTVEIVWGAIKTLFQLMVINALRVGDVITKALSLDFAGAKAAWKRGGEQMVDTFDAAMKKIVKQAAETDVRIKALFDPGAEQGATGLGGKGGRAYTPGAKKEPADKSRMGQWEVELAAMHDALAKEAAIEGTFREFSKAEEAAFWKAKMEMAGLSRDEMRAVSKKYYAAEAEVRKQSFETEQQNFKLQIEAARKGSSERVSLAMDAALKVRTAYGEESKEFKKAWEEVIKIQREGNDQLTKLNEMAFERAKEAKVSVLELERQALDDAEKLGITSNKNKLARLRELKEMEFAIELKAAEDKAALLEDDPVAYQAAMNAILKAKEKHGLDMKKINGQIALELKKSFGTWFDPIGNGFQKLMDGMIQGTQTWSQAIRKTLLAVGAEYLSLGVKLAIDWVKTEAQKTYATMTGVAARGAAEKTGAAESVLTSAWTAIKTIGIAAWKAAAEVYAAIAAIPGVGPFLAPAMAVAAAGTVLSFVGRIASAEGGFDVPRGLSPVTKLHEEEMVLPRDIANPLRESLAGGGVGSLGAANITIICPDTGGMKKWVMNNGRVVVKAAMNEHRNFNNDIFGKR